MNEIYQQLLERNARETIPFLPIYEANASLVNLTDTLLSKCAAAEREVAALRQELQDSAAMGKGGAKGMSLNNSAMKSALKNETRLRDKLELLQEEYNAKLKAESDIQSEALKTANKLQEVQTLNAAHEKTILNLKEEIELGAVALTRLQQQVNDAEASTRLAEQQYDGLKSTIRSLQEENDNLQKENRVMEGRLVTDKGKLVDEMNVLTDLVERLKKEVDMLRSLKHQEEKRSSGAISSWFTTSPKTDTKSSISSDATGGQEDSTPTRKFGSMGIAIVPSMPQRTIAAHTMEGTCVKYDDSGPNLIASASSDSTVKVWDTVSGSLRGTFRGTPGHSVLCCDIVGSLVVGGGSDKTCRVWNLRTERMIHQLVGHQHKITCVRIFGGDKGVLTGSADRSLKVWDISRKTYRQTTTFRHSSTSTCVDVASDAVNVVSGHMDGGLRFWDIRSGERTADISGIHEGGITSVQFNPTDSTHVLTNSLDSTLKVVDIRTGTAVQTFRHAEFSTSHGWSHSVYSPDGRYIASGSSSNGNVFVWTALDGQLKAKLSGGHNAGVVGIDWCRGGSGGQQVASIDRKGVLVLWA